MNPLNSGYPGLMIAGPGAGLGYRLENGLNISAGYTGDIADGYDSHNLRVTFQLPF